MVLSDAPEPPAGSRREPLALPSMPSSIGALRIEREIGRGGMGVVYLAFDERLQRAVAVKVLAQDLAADPLQRARVEREARTLAAVNHPNVATIHGLEEHEGLTCLVLEHVDGETLAERIARGPLPLRETLTACTQVAAALEAVHARGVIHRDLKPCNVKVRLDGTIKVLDFGLARGKAAEGNTGDVASLTGAGEVLGTPGYMSPEHVRGEVLDERADAWSFGCLLHECLTGRPTFGGSSVPARLAAVLERDPDWSALPADTPARVVELLRSCLAKNRADRPRSLGDVRRELESVIAAPTPGARTFAAETRLGTLGTRRRTRRRVVLLAASAVVLALVAAGLAWRTRLARTPASTAAPALRRLTSSPAGTSVEYAAIAPEGRLFASSIRHDSRGVVVRDLHAGESRAYGSPPGPGHVWSITAADCLAPDGSRLIVLVRESDEQFTPSRAQAPRAERAGCPTAAASCTGRGRGEGAEGRPATSCASTRPPARGASSSRRRRMTTCAAPGRARAASWAGRRVGASRSSSSISTPVASASCAASSWSPT